MKIVICNTWYYPNLMGGAEHSVKILTENLAKRGHTVFVLTVDNKDDGVKYEEINNVKVYRLNGNKYDLYSAYYTKRNFLRKIRDKIYEIDNPSIVQDLKKIIEVIRPDLAHINCISGLSFSLLSVLHQVGIPTVVTLRNYFCLCPMEINNQSLAIKMLMKIYQLFVRRMTKNVDAVTAPSLFTLQKHLDRKLFDMVYIKECVPNCVEINVEDTARIIERRKNSSNTAVKYLYVGWLSKSKGLLQLINAFIGMENQYTSLTICGNGELEEYVMETAKKEEQIHFMGKLNPEELKIEYENADILVVPSLWEEPFGRVIIEGAMYGLPVICSNRGGIPEIMQVIKSGCVVNPGDVEELQAAMIQMLDRKTRCMYMDRITKNIIFYSVEKQIDMFEDVYSRVLALKG